MKPTMRIKTAALSTATKEAVHVFVESGEPGMQALADQFSAILAGKVRVAYAAMAVLDATEGNPARLSRAAHDLATLWFDYAARPRDAADPALTIARVYALLETEWIVLYRPTSAEPVVVPLTFLCWARDADHAEAKLATAVPGSEPIWTFHGASADAARADYRQAADACA